MMAVYMVETGDHGGNFNEQIPLKSTCGITGGSHCEESLTSS